MGRIKELCIDLMNANNGIIPEEATIADITRMKELEISNWQDYERHQQKVRVQLRELENSREAEKIQAAGKIFEESLRETKETK
jgi:hypothetical protein